VPNSLLQTSEFQSTLLTLRVCQGGVFSSVQSLARLRFCNHIVGSVIIENITETIDQTVFWHIIRIDGMITEMSIRLMSGSELRVGICDIACGKNVVSLQGTQCDLAADFNVVGGLIVRNTSMLQSIDGFALLESVGSLVDDDGTMLDESLYSVIVAGTVLLGDTVVLLKFGSLSVLHMT
jgi:hypothetical protein